jgi:hypothetical protein
MPCLARIISNEGEHTEFTEFHNCNSHTLTDFMMMAPSRAFIWCRQHDGSAMLLHSPIEGARIVFASKSDS